MIKRSLNDLDPVAYGLSGTVGGAASAGLGHLANLWDFSKHKKEISGLLDYMDNVKADNPKMSEEAIFKMAPNKSEWLESQLRGNTKAHLQELMERTMRHQPTLSLARMGRNATLAGAGGVLTALGVNKIKGAVDEAHESLRPTVQGPVYLGSAGIKPATPKDSPLDTLKNLFK